MSRTIPATTHRRPGPLGELVAVARVAGIIATAVPSGALVAQVADEADLPRILVIATGGTIASRPGADQLTGAAIVEAVPGLGDVARVEVEEFSRIGSSAMTPDHWLRLSRRIDAVFRSDPELAGVVVTHGTDTMEETAYFLHLTVDHRRPVVLTGSMRSATAVSADGPANLLAAARVAVAPASSSRGVLVVINDEIHSARDVRKGDNNRVETFRSAEWGALGIVDLDGVFFRRTVERAHTLRSGVGLPNDGVSLPLVPIVADYAGTDASEMRQWAERGVPGIVVQAFGGGRASPEMRRAMAEAAAMGIVVVVSSRVPEGRVLGSPAITEVGLVTADDLPPHKARVLLMLALGSTTDPAAIQAVFDSH